MVELDGYTLTVDLLMKIGRGELKVKVSYRPCRAALYSYLLLVCDIIMSRYLNLQWKQSINPGKWLMTLSLQTKVNTIMHNSHTQPLHINLFA